MGQLASSGVINYKVEVDQDSSFTAPIFYSPATAPTSSNLNSAGPAGGFPDGTYFWHVATQGTGTGHALGPFSSTFSFIVDTQAPAAPTGGLHSLTNDQTPLLTWNPSSDPCGIELYNIEMSTSSATNPTTGAFTGTNVGMGGSPNPTSAQKQVINVLPSGTYFWHVRAHDNLDHVGSYSSTFTLVIDANVPTAPVITSPTAGTQNTAISTISGLLEKQD